MLPPSASVELVVIDDPSIENRSPKLIVMLPAVAFTSPVLAAEIVPPFRMRICCGDRMVMFPPGPLPAAVVKIPLRASVKKSLKGVGSGERPVGEAPLIVSALLRFSWTSPPAPVAVAMLALAIWPPLASSRAPAGVRQRRRDQRPACTAVSRPKNRHGNRAWATRTIRWALETMTGI